MIIAYSTRRILDVATKPIKLERTYESPTVQVLPRKFLIAHKLGKQTVRPGLEPKNLRHKDDSEKEPENCEGTIVEQDEDL